MKVEVSVLRVHSLALITAFLTINALPQILTAPPDQTPPAGSNFSSTNQNTGGVGGRVMLIILALVGLAQFSFGTTYYVSITGSDSNNGTSQGTPWQTIAKVNAHVPQAGDTILFQGTHLYNGNLRVTVSASAASPFTIGSYGSGHANIKAGNGEGIYVYNSSGVVIQDLDVTGSGAGTNTSNGIEFYADAAGNAKLNYIRIDNVNVTGFGLLGIRIGTWNNLTGYNDVRVTNSTSHDNRQDGMLVYAQARGANTNIYVGNCQFYNNTGISGQTNPAGSGVAFGEVDGGTIEHCLAYNNGAQNTSGSGPVGIWCYDSNNILIQYNESHNNLAGGGDGDGFDLDGGTTNSYLQYNYSHDNKGGGLCLFEYYGAVAHSNNIVRYNVSVNDGHGVWIGSEDSTKPITNAQIYGNILLTSNHECVYFNNANASGVTFKNNIIATNNNLALVVFPGSSGASFSGNDYWPSGAGFKIIWNGKTYTSLSAWGKDAAGVSVDPRPFAGVPPSYWNIP
jgi:hypothetical protein